MTPGNIAIISGCPASGKSTLAKKLSETSERHLHLQTDLFFEALPNLIDPSRPEAKSQNENIVRQYCAIAAGFREDGYHVLIDGVVGPWLLPIVSASLPTFRYAVLHPELEVALRRGASRQEKEVTSEMITKMHGEFEKHRSRFEACYFSHSTTLKTFESIPPFNG